MSLPQAAMMLVRALPCALIWPAAMIVWGPGLVSAKHRHHSVQLLMAIESRLRIRSGPKRPWVECGAAIVNTNALHEVDAAEAQVVLVFADPKSDLGAALLQTVQESITLIQDATVASWRRQLGDPTSLTASRIEPWVRKSLLSVRRTPPLHPKVRRVLEVIREELVTPRRMSLTRTAGIAGLSESRFMHVFTDNALIRRAPSA